MLDAELVRNLRDAPARWVIGAAVVLVLLLALVGGYDSPRAQLRQLAHDTCADVEGETVLTAVGILTAAGNQAQRLGFTTYDLGDEMRRECPWIMRQIENWGR